jgi:hypothetical protein
MAPKKDGSGMRYVVEKIIVLNLVAIAELAGEIYVVPPKTMVTISPVVPHSWVAAPAGLDLQAVGVADEPVVFDGQFLAVLGYEAPTAFFPTAAMDTLGGDDEHVRCEHLKGIRIPPMNVQFLKEKTWSIWDRSCQNL